MERDDAELIRSILSGDETAFSDLVKKYQKSVHALAWRKIGDFHIAEEITQDAFLQANKKLASLKNPSQFAGWLYVITDRLCKAWFRKKQLNKQLDTQSLEATSEETLEKTAYANYVRERRDGVAIEHQRQIVQRLMEKLPEGERTVMVLHYLGEMSCEEISKFLGVSPNTVKSRLHRARKNLRNQVVLDIQSKPDLQNRVGNDTTPVKNSNNSLSTGTQSMQNSIVPDITQWNLPEDAKARLGKGDVTDIQYSPDGKFLTVSSDIGIWLYDVTVHQEASLITGHTSGVLCLAFSPDGRILASGNGDSTLTLHDRITETQKTLIGLTTDYIRSIAFSPDGKTIASGGHRGPILLWDAITGEEKYTLPNDSDWAIKLLFTPDAETLVSVHPENKITLWNPDTGKHKKTFAMHPDCYTVDAAFSPDAKTLAIGSVNGTIYLHDLNTGELKMNLAVYKEHVCRLAFSPDGKYKYLLLRRMKMKQFASGMRTRDNTS